MTTSTASLLSISLLAFGTTAAATRFILSTNRFTIINSKMPPVWHLFKMNYGMRRLRLRYSWLY
jgi:hypothetical protein